MKRLRGQVKGYEADLKAAADAAVAAGAVPEGTVFRARRPLVQPREGVRGPGGRFVAAPATVGHVNIKYDPEAQRRQEEKDKARERKEAARDFATADEQDRHTRKMAARIRADYRAAESRQAEVGMRARGALRKIHKLDPTGTDARFDPVRAGLHNLLQQSTQAPSLADPDQRHRELEADLTRLKGLTDDALVSRSHEKTLGRDIRGYEKAFDKLKGAGQAVDPAAVKAVTDAKAAMATGDYVRGLQVLNASSKSLSGAMQQAASVTKTTTASLVSNYAVVSALSAVGRGISAGASGFISDPGGVGFGTGAMSVIGGGGTAMSRFGGGMFLKHGFSAKGIGGLGIMGAGGAVTLGAEVLSQLASRGAGVTERANAHKAVQEELYARMYHGGQLPDFGAARYVEISEDAAERSRLWDSLPNWHGYSTNVETRAQRDARLNVKHRSAAEIRQHQYLPGTFAANAELARASDNAKMDRSSFRMRMSRPGLGFTSGEIDAAQQAMLGSGVLNVAGRMRDEYGDVAERMLVRGRVLGFDTGGANVSALLGGVGRGRFRMGSRGGFSDAANVLDLVAGAAHRTGMQADPLLASLLQDRASLAGHGVYGGANTLHDSARFAADLAGGGMSAEGISRHMSSLAGQRGSARDRFFAGFKSMGESAAMMQGLMGANSFTDVARNFENMTDASQVAFRESQFGKEGAALMALADGVSSGDATAAGKRGGGLGLRGLELNPLAFVSKGIEGAASAREIGFAEESNAFKAAAKSLTTAVDQAATDIEKAFKSVVVSIENGVR